MNTPVAPSITVRCFHGENARGNLHAVVAARDGWTSQQAAAWSLRIAPTIVVLVRERAGASHGYCYELNYFCNGIAITRCGSGSLAAAKALMSIGSAQRPPFTFLTRAGDVQVIADGDDMLGYRIPPLQYCEGTQRRQWGAVIDRAVRNVVLIGSDRDYCLMELRDTSSLRQCRINPRRLTLMSGRALIVTVPCTDREHDYALRYFSPQYGNLEDGATGSAHAMVAAYWQRRLLRPYLRGLQQSAGGGEFVVRRQGLAQCVYGRADIESFHALPIKPLARGTKIKRPR